MIGTILMLTFGAVVAIGAVWGAMRPGRESENLYYV